jgi:transcriptional regulator with XRE-family HTH domain
MAKRGRPPNLQRRQQAVNLRKEGLTLPQIGQRMGISKQAVHQLLGKSAGLRPILCRLCHSVIVKARLGIDSTRLKPLCLRCLPNLSNAKFGERLLAFRVARGLTQKQLSEATGVTMRTIGGYELGIMQHPKRETLLKLARFLGPTLVEGNVPD